MRILILLNEFFRALAVLALVLIYAVVNSQSSSATENQPPSFNAVEVEHFVDSVIDTYIEKNQVAGATVSIVKDGEIVLKKGFGFSDIDPLKKVDPATTLFRVGSVSKTFTWTAIMQLEEAGKLSLQDPVNDHLPDLLKMPDEGFAEPIRIWHLMSHTSGLENTRLGHVLELSADKIRPLDEYLAAVRPHRVREPGIIISYSNYATQLAGAIIANVSGETYFDYIEGHILEPLGMDHTSFREPHGRSDGMLPEPMSSALEENVSKPFIRSDEGWKTGRFEFLSHGGPAGSMSSTALDMTRFMLAHLGDGESAGKRILKAETAQRMRRTLFTNAEGLDGMAYGFFKRTLAGGYDGYGHSGGTFFFLSNMFMVPELQLGVFVSVNTITGGELVDELPQRLVSHFFPRENTPALVDENLSNDLQGFAGKYTYNRNSQTRLERFFLSLFTGEAVVEVTDKGQLIFNIGSEVIHTVRIGPMMFRSVEETFDISFLQDSKGRITHFSMGPDAFDRVGFFSGLNWLGLIAALSVVMIVTLMIEAWQARKKNLIIENRAEAIAIWVLRASAGVWTGFFIFFSVSCIAFISDPLVGFAEFPSPVLLIALTLGLLATVLTLASPGALYFVWKQRHGSLASRIIHSVVAAVFLLLVLTLNHWNIIGFKYV